MRWLYIILLEGKEVGTVTVKNGAFEAAQRSRKTMIVVIGSVTGAAFAMLLNELLVAFELGLDTLEGKPCTCHNKTRAPLSDDTKTDLLKALHDEHRQGTGKLIAKIRASGGLADCGYKNDEEAGAHISALQVIMNRYAAYLVAHPEDRPTPPIEE